MAIVDLSLFGGEDLVFKGIGDGEEYRIPYGISTDIVILFKKYEKDVKTLKDNDAKAVKLTKKIVMDILNLDKTKNIDMEYLDKWFNNINVLKAIVDATSKHIRNIRNNPN